MDRLKIKNNLQPKKIKAGHGAIKKLTASQSIQSQSLLHALNFLVPIQILFREREDDDEY